MNRNFPEPKFIPLEFNNLEIEDQKRRAEEFYELLKHRRTVREYSEREVAFELIEKAIQTAATAPSGANLQPWRFVVVKDAEIKRKIRTARRKRNMKAITGECQRNGCGGSRLWEQTNTSLFWKSRHIL